MWVLSDEESEAHMEAEEYLLHWGWNVVLLDTAVPMRAMQIERLGKQEAALYEQALKHGISAAILGSPKGSLQVDLEIRPLKPAE